MGTPSEPKRRRRDRGDGTIAWDKVNKCWVGSISLGTNSDGTRNRPSVRGRTKTEAKDNPDKLREELNAGIRTPATYTIEQCVKDWLDSVEYDEHTMETLTGQAKNWLYPKIGATKLRDFSATDADKFFKALATKLSKRTLMMIKSTLRRSIRRAQVHDLIGRNVVELVDLPTGQPGRPSRAMTQAQAGKVLKAASGQAPASRPRGTAHSGLDHEQQRRTNPGDQRHRGPQVNPRYRDRLPPCDRARDPWRSDRDGRRLWRGRRRRRDRRKRQERLGSWLGS